MKKNAPPILTLELTNGGRALAVGQEPGRLDRNSRFALPQHARHPPHVAGDGLGTSPRPEARSNPRKCMPLGYLASFHCGSTAAPRGRARHGAQQAGSQTGWARGTRARRGDTSGDDPVAPRHVEQPWQGARPRRGRGSSITLGGADRTGTTAGRWSASILELGMASRDTKVEAQHQDPAYTWTWPWSRLAHRNV